MKTEKNGLEPSGVKTQYLAGTSPYLVATFPLLLIFIFSLELSRPRSDIYFLDKKVLYQLSY